MIPSNTVVSIVIPCHNQAEYLPSTLKSVLNQTLLDWECIIVNDGSTDKTEEVAKAFFNGDKRFKYLNKENGGPSSARNAGILTSSGKFILPLDSDDLIEETYLEKAVKHFTDFPNTKLVYCKVKLFGNIGKVWELEEYNYENLLLRNMIFCSAMFKKSDFDNTNGYNQNMIFGLEDWDFWLSLLNKQDIVYQIPEVLFYYRISDNSRNRSLSKEKLTLMERQIVNNHKDKYEKFLPNIIECLRNDQKDTISYLNNELLRIQTSKAYRVGKLLIKPFSKIKQFLKYSEITR